MHKQAKNYFTALTTRALRLVGAVQDEGHDAIRAALAEARVLRPPRGIDPDTALAIVLAALVNPDAQPSDLLAHTRHLTNGLADLYPNPTPGPEHYRCNALAVEMALQGHLPGHALNPAEQARTVTILTARGWPTEAIAARLGAEPHDIRDWAATARSLTGPAAA